jgi:hypothetical protein
MQTQTENAEDNGQRPLAAARCSASLVVSEKAIEEVRAVNEARHEEETYGPRYHAKCPDCGATVNVRTLENGRHELEFVKHAI